MLHNGGFVINELDLNGSDPHMWNYSHLLFGSADILPAAAAGGAFGLRVDDADLGSVLVSQYVHAAANVTYRIRASTRQVDEVDETVSQKLSVVFLDQNEKIIPGSRRNFVPQATIDWEKLDETVTSPPNTKDVKTSYVRVSIVGSNLEGAAELRDWDRIIVGRDSGKQ